LPRSLQYLADGDRGGQLPATAPVVEPKHQDIATVAHGAVQPARGRADLPPGAVPGAQREVYAARDRVVPDGGADVRPPPGHPASRDAQGRDEPLGGRDRVGDPPRADPDTNTAEQ
jgi:hypothetical protein